MNEHTICIVGALASAASFLASYQSQENIRKNNMMAKKKCSSRNTFEYFMTAATIYR